MQVHSVGMYFIHGNIVQIYKLHGQGNLPEELVGVLLMVSARIRLMLMMLMMNLPVMYLMMHHPPVV